MSMLTEKISLKELYAAQPLPTTFIYDFCITAQVINNSWIHNEMQNLYQIVGP